MIQVSERIRLKHVEEKDYLTALPWYQDKKILWFSENRTEPYDLEDLKRMYGYLSKIGELYFIEYFDETWQTIGDVTLAKETMPMVIESKYHGLGIGQRIMKALLKRALVLGIDEISLKGIYLYNKGSQHFYRKCGFNETKRDEQYVYMTWRKETS